MLLYLNWISDMVLELTFSVHCLHVFSNKVILSTATRRVSKLQTLVPDSSLILSSDRTVTDYIYFDISEASLSSISPGAVWTTTT